jgi:hypothetical protein
MADFHFPPEFIGELLGGSMGVRVRVL